MSETLYLGLFILIIGVFAVAFPRNREYLTRLINTEIAAFGLLLVFLSLSETIALVTFVAVNGISTFIFVRIIERRQG
ncbi:MAG: DUF2107 family protein [Methanospirillaceae archaeon]|nr:DUF2107 family protein [Methanospirillaceae archaeon]